MIVKTNKDEINVVEIIHVYLLMCFILLSVDSKL